MTKDERGETREQAATRRRWINLAELVAVAGVVIAALSLWLSWSDRQTAEVERTAEVAKTSRFELRAQPARDGAALALTHDDRHDIQDLRVTFPSALGVGSQQALADEISRDWFAKPLLHATDGGADRQTGRLPVLIAVHYSDGDETRTTTGIYDIVWHTEGGGLLKGRTLTLEALKLRRRSGDQQAVDRLWSVAKPVRG